MNSFYLTFFVSLLWVTVRAQIVKTNREGNKYFFTTSSSTERITTDPLPFPYEYDNGPGNTATFNYENQPYYFTTSPEPTEDIPVQFEYKNGATSPKSLIPSHVLVTLYKAARKNLNLKK